MSQNGIATAGDFRKLADVQAFEPPQRVVLPKCGFPVIMRRPRPLAFTLLGHPLPASLAAKLEGGESPVATTPEEIRAANLRISELLRMVLVSPKLSMNPGPEEIHPAWIPDEDKVFILRWTVGEILAGTGDLGLGTRDSGLGTQGGDPTFSPAPSPPSPAPPPHPPVPSPSASDLAAFREGVPGPDAPPRADGGDVWRAPQPDSDGHDCAVAV